MVPRVRAAAHGTCAGTHAFVARIAWRDCTPCERAACVSDVGSTGRRMPTADEKRRVLRSNRVPADDSEAVVTLTAAQTLSAPIYQTSTMSKQHISIATLCVLAVSAVQAQDPAPSIRAVGSVKTYSYTSKATHNQSKDELALADEHVVRQAGASFLQIGFGKGQLSEGSLLEVTSLEDGEVQIFDSDNFERFSYFFNGSAVRLRLHVAARHEGGTISVIESLAVGGPGVAGPQTICGSSDNRTRSSDRRVARLLFRRGSSTYVCTAFLMGRVNCFSSAGHCFNNSATAPCCAVQRASVLRRRAAFGTRAPRVSIRSARAFGVRVRSAMTGPCSVRTGTA